MSKLIPTATHWGCYSIEVEGNRVINIHHYPSDPDPSPIKESLRDALDPNCRIKRPAVRQSYLQQGPSRPDLRGKEPFVEVSWDEALEIVHNALASVKAKYGNESIFGGS